MAHLNFTLILLIFLSCNFQVTHQLEKPVLTSISPALVTTDGGETITITGKNFTNGELYIGGKKCQSLKAISASQATCVVPENLSVGWDSITYKVQGKTVSTGLTLGRGVVLGQKDFNTTEAFRTGLSNPMYISSNSDYLFVAEWFTCRLLGFKNADLIDNTSPPSLVLGSVDANQMGFLPSSAINVFNAASKHFSHTPAAVVSDGTRVVSSDAANHRVLIWNSFPKNGQDPDLVLGQPDFESKTANNGGVSASSLNGPRGVTIVNGQLFVVDYGNSRILIWNSIPTVNNQAADIVLGQPDFASNTANNGGVSATSLSLPQGIDVRNNKLIVSDEGNRRVLIWNTVPSNTATHQRLAADIVIGQAAMTTNASGLTSTTLNGPRGVYLNGDELFVSDYNNNRVLLYKSLTFTAADNGKAASIVLGQPNFTTSTANNGGVSDISLNGPIGLTIFQNKLVVSDYNNHRLLIWNTIPNDPITDIRKPASLVWGQQSFTTKVASLFKSSGLAGKISLPTSAGKAGNKFVLVDQGNQRVLIWNSMPLSKNTQPDVVLGQADLTGNLANRGATPTAQTVSNPTSFISDGTKLIVTDQANNRVLIWSTFPTANGQPADLVLGQPNFTSNTVNNGGISASTMYQPYGAILDGARLIISDFRNNRVLIWNTFPVANGEAADVVAGQPDFISSTANNGGISSTSFNSPTNLSLTLNGNFFISDLTNSRLLGWVDIADFPASPPDYVFNQPNFTTGSNPVGIIPGRTVQLRSVVNDRNGDFLIADPYLEGFLRYSSVPGAAAAAASKWSAKPFSEIKQEVLDYHPRSPIDGVINDGYFVIADIYQKRVLILPEEIIDK